MNTLNHEDRPQKPPWVYLDRAFPEGWNRGTRMVEWEAALAPWRRFAHLAAHAAARRVGKAIATGQITKDHGEMVKREVQDLYERLGKVCLKQSIGAIARDLGAIANKLNLIC